jgi:hypothetical protein
MIKKVLHTIKRNRFLATGIDKVDRINIDAEPYQDGNEILDIICIAYNNPQLIPLQHRLIKKYVKGGFNYTIADNSADANARAAIKKYCSGNGVGYIALPENPYHTGSPSHGIAINWMLKNYIPVKRAAVVGFIDHDIFPVDIFDIKALLQNQPFYGLLQQRDKIWYLWPGFCFFRSGKVDFTKMNFIPGKINGTAVDTGGRLWKDVYSKYNMDKLIFPAESYKELRKGTIKQSDQLQVVDGWIHSINGSYWMAVEKKENLVMDYLEKYL